LKIHADVIDSNILKKLINMLSKKGAVSKDICVIISVPDFQKDGWIGLLLMEQLEPFIKILSYKIES